MKPRFARRPPRPPRPIRRCIRRGPPLGLIFQVVVQCQTERDQRRVYEQMTAAGRKCRVLTL